MTSSTLDLDTLRHDCAHILGQAVQELFPNTQVTIGPVIEHGFYYDFARENNESFSLDDLAKIEERMHEIVDQAIPIVRHVWTKQEAIQYFQEQGEVFKVELVKAIPDHQEISIYQQGEWLDLCKGPHGENTQQAGHAFKLTKVAGSYWRGNAKNPMLQRIYGTAWRTEKELRQHLLMLEEAQKRDHRKLGQELDLFHLQDEAQGSVFWHPKGFVLWRELETYLRWKLDQYGYQEVKTPQLLHAKFWKQSGHWDKFRENMFIVPDVVPSTETQDLHIPSDAPIMALKPMNCPAHIQIFKQGVKSYRDLPIRLSEFGCCHRNEAHGALHGLMRVRQMTQDDAHIFCSKEQIFSEITSFCQLFQEVYADFGFHDIHVKLATRPDVRAGEDSLWDEAESKLEQSLKELSLPFVFAEGEGAFYGPKLEFHLKDAIGRSWQCGTLQLDFVLPERLDASYIGEDGEKHRPVMLHRAIFGTLERFLGILIENYAGKFPGWLAPEQVVVASIVTDEAITQKADEIVKSLRAQNIRATADIRNEKINYKIREHMARKVFCLIIIGKKEVAENTVSLRFLGSKEQTVLPFEEVKLLLAQKTKKPYDSSRDHHVVERC